MTSIARLSWVTPAPSTPGSMRFRIATTSGGKAGRRNRFSAIPACRAAIHTRASCATPAANTPKTAHAPRWRRRV